LSKSSDIEDVEQFMREYRAERKDFVLKSESKDDRRTVGQAIFSMQMYELEKRIHENALLKPPLTFDEALRRVPKGILGRRDVRKVNELLMKDEMEQSGVNIDIAAHAFKISLDYVRARRLIRDSEDTPRRLKDCTEQNVKLQEELRQARQRISDLENLARLHGIDPSPSPRTLGGDVQER
jgi:hypothetical protein